MGAIRVQHGGLTTSSTPLTLARTPYVSTGNIYWVDSVTGSDSNSGLLQDEPLATVFGASGAISLVTTATSATVICLATHRETVSSAYSFSKTAINIVGLGSGTARPQFTSGVTGTAWSMAAQIRMENLYFAASSAVSNPRIDIDAAGCELRDCQFDCGASDTGSTVRVTTSGDYARIVGCTFTATAEGASVGLLCNAAVNGLLIEDCTFSGGSVGWDGNALDITTAAPVGFRIRNLTLSNYSDASIGVTASKGYISGLTVDATSSWSWTE